MAEAATPDYRKTLFETATLPVHSGEPDYTTIRDWHNILKANSMKVHTRLFGGRHGYLALLLSPARYALISAAGVVRPAHPGILLIPPAATQHLIRTMQDLHKEELRLFRECQGVEAALQAQLVEAVDPMYLEALRDADTNAIGLPIYDIVRYLYDTYGDISPETLEEERQKTNLLTFDPSLPVDIIFTKIAKFTDLADAARSPLTQKQSVDFAYNAFRRSGIFTKFLMDWDEKPLLAQTWIQLKIDFRSAVKKLKKAGTLTTNAMHANLVQDIVNGVQEALQPTNIDADYSSMPSVTPTVSTDDTSLTQQIQVNAVTDGTVLAMQKQIDQLTQMISQMQPNQQGGQQYRQQEYQGYQRFRGGRGGRRGGRNTGGRGRGRGRGQFNANPFNSNQTQNQNPFQQNQQQNPFQNQFQQQQRPPRSFERYCWTHGMCGHTSNICNRPGWNHNYEATIDNKMNGNTSNCPT